MTGALQGLRVVNTRAVHQAAALDRLLVERGAVPISYPCIAIAPPSDPAELDEELRRLVGGQFDWLVLTSTNAVRATALRLDALGLRMPHEPKLGIATVGPATARAACDQLGVASTLVPETNTGAELAASIPVREGDAVLLPQSEIAGRDAIDALRARGATATAVTAYRTVIGEGGAELSGLLRERAIDALTFCSPSAVDGFVQRIEREGASLAAAQSLTTVCIGPTTHTAAVRQGFSTSVKSDFQSLDSLVSALEQSLVVQLQGGKHWS
jgi:uroporphyrinogen-III synthase